MEPKCQRSVWGGGLGPPRRWDSCERRVGGKSSAPACGAAPTKGWPAQRLVPGRHSTRPLPCWAEVATLCSVVGSPRALQWVLKSAVCWAPSVSDWSASVAATFSVVRSHQLNRVAFGLERQMCVCVCVQNRFRFAAKLSRKYMECPYDPPDTHLPHTTSPPINTPHQSGVLVTADGPTLTPHCHPKRRVYVTIHSWHCTLCGL